MATLTMTPAEVAEYEAFKASQATQTRPVAAAVITKAAKKQQAPKSSVPSALALPAGVQETADAYIITVPKAGPWHVSASGKSAVVSIERLLPKGTHGIGVFGKLFRPL